MNCIYQELIDLSTEELIGSIMIGLVLAMAFAGLYALGRRKTSDRLPLLSSLMILASIVSMALGIGYGRYKQDLMGYGRPGQPPSYGPGGPPPGVPGHRAPPGGPEVARHLAERFIGSADVDGEGRISPEEAARAAERLVREADSDQRGSIDVETLSRVLDRRLGLPRGFGPGAFGPEVIIDAVDARDIENELKTGLGEPINPAGPPPPSRTP